MKDYSKKFFTITSVVILAISSFYAVSLKTDFDLLQQEQTKQENATRVAKTDDMINDEQQKEIDRYQKQKQKKQQSSQSVMQTQSVTSSVSDMWYEGETVRTTISFNKQAHSIPDTTLTYSNTPHLATHKEIWNHHYGLANDGNDIRSDIKFAYSTNYGVEYSIFTRIYCGAAGTLYYEARSATYDDSKSSSYYSFSVSGTQAITSSNLDAEGFLTLEILSAHSSLNMYESQDQYIYYIDSSGRTLIDSDTSNSGDSDYVDEVRVYIDRLYFVRSSIENTVRSKYRYTSDTTTQHKVEVPCVSHANELKLYYSDGWEYSSITPTASVSDSSNILTVSSPTDLTYIVLFSSIHRNILAITETTKKYQDYVGFEGGNDWVQAIRGWGEYETNELDSSIVSEGAYSLHLKRTTGYDTLSILTGVLPNGYFYYSFDFYLISYGDLDFMASGIDGWDIVSLDDGTYSKNTWYRYFGFINLYNNYLNSEEDVFRFRATGTGTSEFYLDNFQLFEVSTKIKQLAPSQSKIYGSFMVWDGYKNPAASNVNTTFEIWDRTQKNALKSGGTSYYTSIANYSARTNDVGFVSFLYNSSFTEREYEIILYSDLHQEFDYTELDIYIPFDSNLDQLGATSKTASVAVGTLSDTSGKFGGAKRQDTLGDYITLDSNFYCSDGHSYTISFWVNARGTMQNNWLWAVGVAGTSADGLGIHTNGGDTYENMFIRFNDGTYHFGPSEGYPDYDGSFLESMWVHIAFTVDTSRNIKYYFNGYLMGTKTHTNTLLIVNDFMRAYPNSAYYTQADWDDFRVYEDICMSQDQIQSMMYLHSARYFFTPHAAEFSDFAETDLADAWDYSEGDNENMVVDSSYASIENGVYKFNGYSSNNYWYEMFDYNFSAYEYETIQIRFRIYNDTSDNYGCRFFVSWDKSDFWNNHLYHWVEPNDQLYTGADSWITYTTPAVSTWTLRGGTPNLANIERIRFDFDTASGNNIPADVIFEIDFIRIIHEEEPILYDFDNYFVLSSTSDTYRYQIYSDSNSMGLYSDCELIPKNLTAGEHNFTAVLYSNAQNKAFIPTIFEYLYYIHESDLTTLLFYDNQGRYIDSRQFVIYVDGYRIYGDTFYWEDIFSTIEIEIEDVFGHTLYYNATETYKRFKDYILQYYSVKIQNMQETPVWVSINSNGQTFSSWIFNMEIEEYRIYANSYTFTCYYTDETVTDFTAVTTNGTYVSYSFTVSADTALIISGRTIEDIFGNTISLLDDLGDTNSSIHSHLSNQTNNITIQIDNTNTNIGTQTNNIIIEIANTNSTLGEQLNTISTDINNLQTNVTLQINDISSQIGNLQTNVTVQFNDLNQTVLNVQTNQTLQYNDLTSLISNFESHIDTQLSSITTQIDNNLSNITLQFNDVDTSITNVQSNITTQLNEIDVLISNFESHIDTQLNSLNITIMNNLANITAQFNDVELSIINLQTNITNQFNNISTLIVNFETSMDSQLNDIDVSIENNLSNITLQFNDMNVTLTNIHTNITTQINDLYTQINNVNSSIAAQFLNMTTTIDLQNDTQVTLLLQNYEAILEAELAAAEYMSVLRIETLQFIPGSSYLDFYYSTNWGNASLTIWDNDTLILSNATEADLLRVDFLYNYGLHNLTISIYSSGYNYTSNYLFNYPVPENVVYDIFYYVEVYDIDGNVFTDFPMTPYYSNKALPYFMVTLNNTIRFNPNLISFRNYWGESCTILDYNVTETFDGHILYQFRVDLVYLDFKNEGQYAVELNMTNTATNESYIDTVFRYNSKRLWFSSGNYSLEATELIPTTNDRDNDTRQLLFISSLSVKASMPSRSLDVSSSRQNFNSVLEVNTRRGLVAGGLAGGTFLGIILYAMLSKFGGALFNTIRYKLTGRKAYDPLSTDEVKDALSFSFGKKRNKRGNDYYNSRRF